ncbi:AMP-binding protein [Parvibaculum sp.]|uniref:acyl-CoA synthetase n=1 Tax=Parvibaculum sp. TaxID=2024848 RepID=UPI0025CDAF19|nr:AMP-binding protein [Parvibaculum sp.]
MTPNMTDYAETYRNFQWNIPPAFNFGGDVVDYFARHADGLALIWANDQGCEERYSFSDMARLSSRFASALQQRGVCKGDRVIVMTPRIPQWQVAIVGCLKLGAVPIPCIEMLTAKDIAYRVQHAGATAVFARAEHAPKFEDLADSLKVRIALGEAPGWETYDKAMADGRDDFAPVRVEADDAALLYYTSGSTGQPKGVLHASRAIHAWRESAINWLDLRRDDTIWCTADVGWSKAGTSILFGPWSCGACVFFYEGAFDPAERLRLLEKYRVTVYCAPGTELFRIVNEDASACDLSHLRHTVSAGEALNNVVGQRWHAMTGVPVLEAYGQTETLMTLLNYPCMPMKEGSMGLPAPGSVLDIIDADGERVPAGEEGDIAILMPNPQMMLGYWRDEARTQESYIDGVEGRWFITGDRGIRDAEGYFFHRGRRDDIINSAGYRIGPSEIENVLLEHPAVQECAVIGAPHEERGEIVKAVIVLRNGVSPSDELARELQEHVKRQTAPYKYPRAVEFLDALPKTQTGKIQRAALRQREKLQYR